MTLARREAPIRASAGFVVVFGFLVLGQVLYHVASGLLVRQYFGSPPAGLENVYAPALSLPVPLHIIAVGLVVQLPWLSPAWAKGTRRVVVVSGCRLGRALGTRWLCL